MTKINNANNKISVTRIKGTACILNSSDCLILAVGFSVAPLVHVIHQSLQSLQMMQSSEDQHTTLACDVILHPWHHHVTSWPLQRLSARLLIFCFQLKTQTKKNSHPNLWLHISRVTTNQTSRNHFAWFWLKCSSDGVFCGCLDGWTCSSGSLCGSVVLDWLMLCSTACRRSSMCLSASTGPGCPLLLSPDEHKPADCRQRE